MANVTYNPAPGDPDKTSWGGYDFEKGKSVKVDNPAILAKAKNNPHFEVSGASKEEQRQAEIVGGYADANTGQPVELVRTPRAMPYGTSAAGPTGSMPPSSATQGSAAVDAVAAGNFEEVFGGTQEEIASGEHETAPEYQGPQGTEGAKARRGRPPKGEK